MLYRGLTSISFRHWTWELYSEVVYWLSVLHFAHAALSFLWPLVLVLSDQTLWISELTSMVPLTRTESSGVPHILPYGRWHRIHDLNCVALALASFTGARVLRAGHTR